MSIDKSNLVGINFNSRDLEWIEEDIDQAIEVPYALHVAECKKCQRDQDCRKTAEIWETYHDDTRLIGFIDGTIDNYDYVANCPFSGKAVYWKIDPVAEYSAIVDGFNVFVLKSRWVCRLQWKGGFLFDPYTEPYWDSDPDTPLDNVIDYDSHLLIEAEPSPIYDNVESIDRRRAPKNDYGYCPPPEVFGDRPLPYGITELK